MGEKAVLSRLKDPDSAEFKDVFFARAKDNVPVVCGEVNSKNSFGGFVGFQSFISAGSSDTTFLQSEVEDFKTLWESMCAR